jgi:predicted nucleic acid-binding protein
VTTGCVVDASVILSLVLGEDATFERARRILGELRGTRLLVPVIWQTEVANVLVTKERQRRIDASFVQRALRHFEGLPVEVDVAAATSTFDLVVPLARRHHLTTYDATYLELALRERAPLATFDDALATAANRERVAVLGGT